MLKNPPINVITNGSIVRNLSFCKSPLLLLLIISLYSGFLFSPAHADDDLPTFPLVSKVDPSGQDGADSLLFFVDTAAFLGNEGFVYQEIYYEIPTQQLRFVTVPDGKYEATVEIMTSILSTAGDTLDVDQFPVTIPAASQRDTKQKGLILQQSAFFLLPGDYRVAVQVTDAWSSSSGRVQAPLQVMAFPDTFCISDPEFALRIMPLDPAAPSIFGKGAQLVHPCASRHYGQTRPELKLYFELYNCTVNNDPIHVTYTILDADGDVAVNPTEQQFEKPGDTCAVTASLAVGNLREGDYQIQIVASDGPTQVTIGRPFKIVYMGDDSWTPEIMAQYRLLIKYFGDSSDVSRFDRLTRSGKIEFWQAFWKQRDPIPSTAENEFLMEVVERVKLAGERFTSPIKKGWATDAGRILIKFGMPNDIENYEDLPDKVPHEIWYYYDGNQKAREFWFLTSGPEPYRLIHNVAEPGEIDLPNWQLLLQKAYE